MLPNEIKSTEVIVIGGGFSGLAAAYELSKQGIAVKVLESESEIGGLAASFEVEGEKLDRFYHHWFTNDESVMTLIDELNLHDRLSINPTNTAVYYANKFFKLSSPIDLLKFTPLTFLNRIRLGLLALRARRVKDWKKLEDITAENWLKKLGGEQVYQVVWEPLLKGKFGDLYKEISAVWFWNKLKLRGGSRGKGGEERLAYFKGGFIALAKEVEKAIVANGGQVITDAAVLKLSRHQDGWSVQTANETYIAHKVVSTVALPILADLLEEVASPKYLSELRRINYLGNVCLVFQLSKSLSETYWLNVNDPSFPFVGVIEHTNFESADVYGGRHIVYLSKYLSHTDALYLMSDKEVVDFSLPYLMKMFPAFDTSTIIKCNVWRARWSQPVVEKNYSQLIPDYKSPLEGLYLASMAQIYPEDRGTNYAIREGRSLAKKICAV